MPNTPALVGAGVAGLSGGMAATSADLDWAEGILAAVGTVVRLPERQLDAVTGLSGSGPAYVFLMAEAMIEAGVTAGLPRDVSSQLVVGTLLGSSRMLDETGLDPAELRAAVTSPGGTTAAGCARWSSRRCARRSSRRWPQPSSARGSSVGRPDRAPAWRALPPPPGRRGPPVPPSAHDGTARSPRPPWPGCPSTSGSWRSSSGRGTADGLLRAARRRGPGQRGQGPQGPVAPRLVRHPGRGLRRRLPGGADRPAARARPRVDGGHRRHREPGAGAGPEPGLRRPELHGRGPHRHRPGRHRRADRRRRGTAPRRPARPSPPGARWPSASSPRPAPVAQRVADLLVDAGVRSLLNFAPRVLEVPPGVLLRYVDLSMELQVMSFYQARQLGRRGGRPDAGDPVDRPVARRRRTDRPGRRDWRSGPRAAMLVVRRRRRTGGFPLPR